MIRSTRHKINNLNTEKTSKYFLFLEEYSRVVNSIVDNVWIDYVDNNNFNIPKYLDYKLLAIDNLIINSILSLSSKFYHRTAYCQDTEN
jgi:hypothetical protein